MPPPSPGPERDSTAAPDKSGGISSISWIVSQWRDLGSMDQKSPDFLSLLSSLTAEGSRRLTVDLRDDDAKVVLTAMDKVLKGEKNLDAHRRIILHTMRKLAYNSGELPASYQVDRDSLGVDEEVVANGAFADIRMGRLGTRTVAIRTLRINRKEDSDYARKLFCKECIIWMNVSHPNLLHLIGVNIVPQAGQYSAISEMMSGNLMDHIREHQANRHRLLEQAASGLRYLHEHEIVHGDLKGHNILITNDSPPRACLADFGLSILTSVTQGAAATVTAGGTPLYMAPELLAPALFGKTSNQPTKPADIYAFGMVIFEVLAGTQPFDERKWITFELTYRVVSGERPVRPDNAEQFGDGTWELVEKCWKRDPETRPTIEEVHAHLKHVAESSTTIGPAPDIPNKTAPESESFCRVQLFGGDDGESIAVGQEQPVIPSNKEQFEDATWEIAGKCYEEKPKAGQTVEEKAPESDSFCGTRPLSEDNGGSITAGQNATEVSNLGISVTDGTTAMPPSNATSVPGGIAKNSQTAKQPELSNSNNSLPPSSNKGNRPRSPTSRKRFRKIRATIHISTSRKEETSKLKRSLSLNFLDRFFPSLRHKGDSPSSISR